MSLHYQHCVDNSALTSAEDGSSAQMLVVLRPEPQPPQGLQLLQPALPLGFGRVREA